MPAKDKGVLIKHEGEQVTSGLLRARDVEFALKSVEVHPTIKQLMCKLAENQHYQNSQLVQLAQMLDQIINIVQKFSDISENMKAAIQRSQRALEGVEGDESSSSKH